MIEIKEIEKSFGSNHVLKGIDLSVNTGEVVVIIGPSGSGKSTLLRCVNFLERALNPNVATKTSLNFYYNSLINQVANSGDVYKSIYEQEEATLTSVEEARQTVSGVSTDEELQFMIMFQNAYNASSRYINVINSMLDTLINSLQ